MNIKKINVVTKHDIILTSVEIKNGKIHSIGKTCNEEGLDLSNYYLAPGFIDQHIHGADGADFMDGTKEANEKIAKALLQEGTTSFVGTTMTQSIPNINKAIAALNEGVSGGANLIGVHLEGPFVCETFKGAQPAEYILPGNVEQFKDFNKHKNIKIISMAPEEDQDNLVKYCADNNIIVSLAHTNATHDDVVLALKNGAKGFTHGYNAMSKLHHRDIGVVGSMLLYNEAYAELICDGIHVSPAAVRLLYKNKGRENLILITDSMRAKYLPDGKSELGGQEVFVKNNEARLKDGTLAGSILKMNDAVRNMMKFANVTLVDAVYMASTTPAKNLGLTTKGFIAEGMDADLVILDKDINVIKTIVNGKVLYEG